MISGKNTVFSTIFRIADGGSGNVYWKWLTGATIFPSHTRLIPFPMRNRFITLLSAVTGLLLLTPSLQAEPHKAVYRWGQGGCVQGLYDRYAQWLNREVIWAEDFMPNEGWDKIRGEAWQLGTWSNWVSKVKGRRLILSVPLLPGPWDRSGPRQGPGKGEPVSLADGAAGKYNEHFRALAENLVKWGLADTILRPGWEFNGGWYTFRANTEAEAVAFAGFFRQVVTTMRAVPGQNFHFCWNPALEPWWPYDPEKAWPGDEFVDSIGLDVYDQSWMPDTYPIPADADDAERERRQKKTWETKTAHPEKGLPYWVRFARRHGNLPLAIPEWGVCHRQDRHGGGDNPSFIRDMAAFLNDPANNVLFECYFDVGAPDGDHQLITEPGRPTRFPRAAAEYHRIYALPGAPAFDAPVGAAPKR